MGDACSTNIESRIQCVQRLQIVLDGQCPCHLSVERSGCLSSNSRRELSYFEPWGDNEPSAIAKGASVLKAVSLPSWG